MKTQEQLAIDFDHNDLRQMIFDYIKKRDINHQFKKPYIKHMIYDGVTDDAPQLSVILVNKDDIPF